MKFEFDQNYKKISEIIGMRKRGELVVDYSYQRRAVWGEKDWIRLVETILLNLVVPSVYFWNSETDPETGKAILHIVDGQQRITAIQNFVKEIIYSKKRANKGLEINIFLTYHPTKKKISGIINYLSSKLRET